MASKYEKMYAHQQLVIITELDTQKPIASLEISSTYLLKTVEIEESLVNFQDR